MKILVVTENYHAGGMDSFIVNLLNNWPQNDQFIIVCNYDHPGLAIIKERLKIPCNILTHRLFLRGRYYYKTQNSLAWRYVLRPLFGFLQYFVLLHHYLYFMRLVSFHSPDRIFIIAGNYPGGETTRATALLGLGRILKHKPFFIYHNDPAPIRPSFFFVEMVIDYMIEKSVSNLITVSQYTRNAMARRPMINRSDKHIVIYNGIDIHPSLPLDTDAMALLGQVSESAPLLLMLGTYESRKGHEFLLQAFVHILSIIPETRLVMAGFGYPHDQKRVCKLIKDYGLHDHAFMLGFQKEVLQLLRRATVLVVPSQEFESFGLIIVEAFSCAVPVVATRICGIPEVLLEGEGGYTVPLDSRLFAEKVLVLLKDRELRRTIAHKGYLRFKNCFNAKKMAQEYYDIVSR